MESPWFISYISHILVMIGDCNPNKEVEAMESPHV